MKIPNSNNNINEKTVLEVQLEDSKYLQYYVDKFEQEGELQEVHYKLEKSKCYFRYLTHLKAANVFDKLNAKEFAS